MLKFLREKQFTNGFVAVLELDDGKIIETTATCLPISTEMRGTDKTNNIATDYNNYNEGHWKEKYMIGVYRLGLVANNIKPRWKTTLNFALAKETPFEVSEFPRQFDSDNVFIKISPINENVVSEENNIKTLFNNQNTI